MFTRRDYLNGFCSHEDYYSQMVEESNAKQLVLAQWSKEKLKDAFEKDEHFNSIPLSNWDVLGCCLSGVDWKKYGDVESLAGRVCVLKCAAKQIARS